MSVCWSAYVCLDAYGESREGVRLPGAGVTVSCEQLDVGAGT